MYICLFKKISQRELLNKGVEDHGKNSKAIVEFANPNAVTNWSTINTYPMNKTYHHLSHIPENMEEYIPSVHDTIIGNCPTALLVIPGGSDRSVDRTTWKRWLLPTRRWLPSTRTMTYGCTWWQSWIWYRRCTKIRPSATWSGWL